MDEAKFTEKANLGVVIAYLGRMEPYLERGKCAQCGAEGYLHCYSATKYLKLLGLAVLPLTSVRIEDECNFCGRRSITPLNDWQLRRQKEMEQRCDDLQSEAGALAYLRAIQRHHDQEDFFEEAPELAHRFADNPRVMARICETLSIFREFDQAEAGFQKLLEQNDTSDFRRLYALHKLRRGSPRDLEGKFSQPAELYLLVEGYQSRGILAAAEKVLNQIAASWPEQTVTPEYKWYAKRNQRKIKISPAFDLPRPARPFLFEPVVLSILIPFLVVFAVLSLRAGRNREIDLINGSDSAYDLEFAGKTYRLVPGQVETVPLAEGVYTYKSTTPGAPVLPASIKIECFWAFRISDKRHFVLNPDGLAILVSERTVYSKDKSDEKFDPQEQLYLGKTFYEIPAMDYYFEPFPSDISVAEGHFDKFFTRTYERFRLDMVRGGVQAKFETLEKESDRVEYLKSCLDRVPTLELVETAEASLARPSLLKLAKERIELVPTRTIWHILYQDLTWKEQDLLAEYRQRLARAPQDAELQFLLGRLDGHMQGDGPFQRWWRARQQMATGKFESDGGLDSKLPLHRSEYCQELLAQRRFQELLDFNLGPTDRLLALVQANRIPEAEKLAAGEEYLGLVLRYARHQRTGVDLLDGQVERAEPTTWQLDMAVFLMSQDQTQKDRELQKAIERLAQFPPFSPEFQASKILKASGPVRQALELNMNPEDSDWCWPH
jgi:hypothetical protein